ncbi:MAG TPA: MetQ/NlpA family ABC transporter substrate-binding protein [Tetragenococcus sp.]|nr:MetQ/NlpA family ABC transporter substrate-binding protein [Tetragenococcus sp.]
MKKFTVLLLAFFSVGILSACGNTDQTEKSKSAKEDKTITVAVALPTMTDITKIAAKEAKKDGYTIKIAQVNDNVAYNDMVENGEADANFAQHEPFMQQYNEAKDAHLVAIQPIYDVKIGFYSKDYASAEEIPEGKKIAITNDAVNEGRALKILADQGLIKLKEGVGYNGTIKDVVENPHGFEWLKVDLLNLSEAYSEPDVAMIYNYPAYLKKIDLTPKDALFLEKRDSQHFAIQLVTREELADSSKMKELKKVMTSDAIRAYLEDDEHKDSSFATF